MDIQAWLTANWQYALVIAVIGLFLGWLITYVVMRRRRTEYEASISDLNTKVQSGEKALAEARQTADNMKAEVNASQVRLNTAQGQLAVVQGDLDALRSQKEAVDASLMERAGELDELKAAYDQLQLDANALQVQFDDLQESNAALKANLESTSIDLAAAKKELGVAGDALANKEVALNEAYLRAVKLQRELLDNQSVLAATQSELGTLRRDVVSLTSLNQDLEGRLQNSRGEVAGELALLTSTMLRMKEEQLSQANHRIAAMAAEIEAMKAGKVVSR
jgi:chromosome segregation protein